MEDLSLEPKSLVDPDSGEEYRFVAQKKATRQGGFFMGYLKTIGEIAKAEDLTDGDKTVFLHLLAELDFNNYVLVNVSKIAKDLHRDRAGVSRAIKKLTERGILHRGPKSGTSYSYTLDPWTAWRGQATDRERVRREITARKWEVINGDGERARQNAAQ